MLGIELALHSKYKIVVTEINLVLQALPRRRLSFALLYKFAIALLGDILGLGKSTQNPIGRQTNLLDLFLSKGDSDCPSDSKWGNTNHSDPPRFSTTIKPLSIIVIGINIRSCIPAGGDVVQSNCILYA